MNLPLKCFVAIGSGTDSSLLSMSEITSPTSLRMPFNAASGVCASQLKLGNSAQSPTCSASSSDHVTRYVYLSSFFAMFDLQPFDCLEYLFYLIGFCLPFAVLDVYTWVNYQWCLVQ